MNYRKCKLGMRVRITQDVNDAAKDEEGFIHEMRGYNFEGQKKIARWLMVWIDKRPDGKPTRRVISISSNLVKAI